MKVTKTVDAANHTIRVSLVGDDINVHTLALMSAYSYGHINPDLACITTVVEHKSSSSGTFGHKDHECLDAETHVEYILTNDIHPDYEAQGQAKLTEVADLFYDKFNR
jgi:hypothetical protein